MKNPDMSNYMEKIISTMNDGLMIIAPDGKVHMVNRAFENLTGFRIPEVVGRPCTFLNCDACEKTLKEGAAWWCDLFERGEVIRKRCVIVRKDGSYQPVIKNASLLRDENGKLLGAVETLTDISETERLDQRIDHLTHQLDGMTGFHGIVGRSSVMQKVYQVIEKAAQSDAPIAIYGESGTGKELVARAIHEIGRRRNGPFVQLNCAALNEALLESELFGHVKGSFTGAYRHRIGRFEAAHGGELFLDEIADIPLPIQVKLLRVLETKRFERVGDHKPVLADVRIMTATNKDLLDLIRQKKFRDDLFFRINVIPIHLPLLCERLEDLPLLASTFIERLRSRTGKRITGLTPEVMERFMSYSWPGNVRELNSALEYAFVIAESGRIGLEHLPPQFVLRSDGPSKDASSGAVEKRKLIEALRQSQGNQSEAARILGVSRVTVWNRMRRHGIDLKKVLLP